MATLRGRSASGILVLAAACLPAGAQAQVVQGSTVGQANASASTTGVSFASAKAGFQIYAGGPAPAVAATEPAGSVAVADPAIDPGQLMTARLVGTSQASVVAQLAGGANAGSQPGGGGGPSPVPEPDTWSMLIAGFGLAGWSLRRRSARRLPA